jgi:hypothetical protein
MSGTRLPVSLKGTLMWGGLGAAGLAGYLWLRTSMFSIVANGGNYLLPGLLVASVALLTGVLSLRERPAGARAELPFILVGGAAFRLVFWRMPPMFSHDAYRYAWDAHLVAHGVSPWAHPLSDPALAPLRDGAIWPNVNWRNAPTIYPPGAQLIFQLAHLVAPLNISAVQIEMAAFDVATAALTLVLLRQHGLAMSRVALYWWNPIPILDYTFNAHVDIAAAFFALVALLAAIRARAGLGRAIAGVAVAIAGLIKIYPLLYAIALMRRRDRAFFAALAIASALIVAPFLWLGYGSGGFLATYFVQRSFDQAPLFHLITLTIPGATAQTTLQLGSLAGGCGLALWARSRGQLTEAQAMLAITALWLLLSPHLFPWYVGGVLPLLAIEQARGSSLIRGISNALWLFILVAPADYIVFADGINPGLFQLLYLIPVLVSVTITIAPHLRRIYRKAPIPALLGTLAPGKK